MGLFLQPGTQGTDDGGKNADPAEPEQNQLGAVLAGCRDGRSHMPKIMPIPCPKLSVRETDALPEAARRI